MEMLVGPEVKLKAGGYLVTTKIWEKGDRLYFQFPFNKPLLTEIRMMNGSKWHGFDKPVPQKVWSIDINQRNEFQLKFLMGQNPYARYDQELPKIKQLARYHTIDKKEYELFEHQHEDIQHFLVRHFCIEAGEMGIGKSLIAGIAMEQSGFTDWWYVAPKRGLEAVQRDFRIWGIKIQPKWLTYEGLVKIIKQHKGIPLTCPHGVVFDESSKIKNQSSQRSQAAKQLADGIRADWGDSGYVWLMSGTPAPKSPADWYWQCEIACPGFLKEGDIYKFRNTLGIIIQKGDDATGGSYPVLVNWRTGDHICNVCGQFKTHQIHNVEEAFMLPEGQSHEFIPSVNEVARLYKRLKGLVSVRLKKDCLDLPQKNYRIIEIKPNPSILRAAQTIAKSAKTTIEGLTLLRELSDGFQYKQVLKGKKKCDRCQGTKETFDYEEVEGTCPNCSDEKQTANQYGQKVNICPNHIPERKQVKVACPNCDQNGEQESYIREIQEIPCEKYTVLEELLDEYDEIGRGAIFGGFTATIDRCVRTCHKMKWTTIRLDEGQVLIQRPDGTIVKGEDYLTVFQEKLDEYEKVAFVATAGSGGMAVTLTKSPWLVVVSNSFNGTDRMQLEDRIHRPGMDLNLGATIIDIFNLPSDKKVYDNLMKKKDLQSMSLGELTDTLLATKVREE